MTSAAAWVVGSGGQLGSAVARLLPERLRDTRLWSPGPRRFSWNDPSTLLSEFALTTAAYGREVAASQRPWMVLWCAGAGVVGASEDAMAAETKALQMFLGQLGGEVGDRPGAFFLAGSAGGVYGSSPEVPLTESSPTRPSSDYGRAKLRQEEVVRDWAAAHPRVSALVGRISNLYGPRQNLSKPQGLIAQLCSCLLHHVPAHVYAPLDTLRDHLFVADAAEQILACMARLRSLPEPATVLKILASGQTSSIAGILAVFSRIAKRQPRIVCSGSALGKLQPTRLVLRSTVWPDLAPPLATSLAAGIQTVYRAQLALLQEGRLPAPVSVRH